MRALRRAMAASRDGGALEIVGTAADPRLAARVRSYHGFRETTRGPMCRRELPGGRLVLMVELGPPIRFLDRAGGADRAAHPQGFLAGLHTAPVLTETAGAQSGVQVMLTPLGARRLLGLPMADLTDRVVALPDVLGAEGAVLAARLREATGWAARFDAMDAFLLRRLAAAREVPAGIAWACRTLEATAGRTPIARLRPSSAAASGT